MCFFGKKSAEDYEKSAAKKLREANKIYGDGENLSRRDIRRIERKMEQREKDLENAIR